MLRRNIRRCRSFFGFYDGKMMLQTEIDLICLCFLVGNSGSLTTHSLDYGFASSPPGIREAANSLVTALQNCPAPPPPDPVIIRSLLDWLQVGFSSFYQYILRGKYLNCYDFLNLFLESFYFLFLHISHVITI